MIFIKLQGRLGNQLFQYAFGLSVAKQLGVNFALLETDIYSKRTLHYFKLNRFEPVISRIATSLYWRGFLTLAEVREYDDQGVHLDLREFDFQDGILYNGFFQSDSFFSKHQSDVKSHFKVKDIFSANFKRKNHLILFNGRKTLVLNFRGGNDYLSYLLPVDYYNRALQEIGDLNDYNLIVTADNIERAQEAFSHVEGAIFHKKEDIIEDFLWLVNADVAVISNSSFAWWGAYLNEKNAVIYAPKNWMGFSEKIEFPIGIMHPNWNWINT